MKRTNLTEQIEVVGKRKMGKPKLTQDDAGKLVDWCLAHPTDTGAVATHWRSCWGCALRRSRPEPFGT
jgi:hypothetical protein